MTASATARSCDGCTLCCKLLSIPVLEKDRGVWCQHCEIGSGCRIYEQRPDDCRIFACEFLKNERLDERWRPSVARLVLVESAPERLLIAYVDPQRPDAWKKEPYYSSLKRWATERIAARIHVVIYIGRRVVVVAPDKDIDVGHVSDEETIMVNCVPTPSGYRCNASKVRRDSVR